MKKHAYNFIMITLLILFTIMSYAQDSICNRSVWIKSWEKELPKEVCIPEGYIISHIFDLVDINDDGLIDFIFKWRKNNLQNGDTMYVTIYLQNQDGTYEHFRTFNNLYPIYFKSYDLDYVPKDTSLISIHKKYEGEYLFQELIFKKNLIILKIKHEAKEDLWIRYRYDKTKNDWLYQNAELHDYAIDKITSIDLSDKLGPTIDNFTYFYWEEE